MSSRSGFLALCLTLLGSVTASGQTLEQFREQAQAVCMEDVMSLCSEFVPDEDQIMGCMQTRRAQLSPPCRQIFDTGMKARRRTRQK